jgi:hypothetical protein
MLLAFASVVVTIVYSLRFETSLFVASYDCRVTVEVFDPASTRVLSLFM